MIALEVLGQHDEVIAALVGLAFLVGQPAVGYVHLTADDGLEKALPGFGQLRLAVGQLGLGVFDDLRPSFQGRNALFQRLYLVLGLSVLLVDIVIELLHAEHVAMVGQGQAPHAVGHCLVDQALYAGLPVEDGVLTVNV